MAYIGGIGSIVSQSTTQPQPTKPISSDGVRIEPQTIDKAKDLGNIATANPNLSQRGGLFKLGFNLFANWSRVPNQLNHQEKLLDQHHAAQFEVLTQGGSQSDHEAVSLSYEKVRSGAQEEMQSELTKAAYDTVKDLANSSPVTDQAMKLGGRAARFAPVVKYVIAAGEIGSEAIKVGRACKESFAAEDDVGTFDQQLSGRPMTQSEQRQRDKLIETMTQKQSAYKDQFEISIGNSVKSVFDASPVGDLYTATQFTYNAFASTDWSKIPEYNHQNMNELYY